MKMMAEQPAHAVAIEALLDAAFGEDRRHKTVYGLRVGVEPVAGLSLVIEGDQGELLATLRFWPVDLVSADGTSLRVLLLGPIAVGEELRGTGLGTALMERGLDLARGQGWPAVLLVGDEPYYRRFGFQRALAESLELPGPVDLKRFLGLELDVGSLSGRVARVVSVCGKS